MRKKTFSFLGLMCCAAIAFSQNVFVAVDGDNSNSGTIDLPYASFEEASLNRIPGDTIFVRGGEYTSRQKIKGAGGAIDNPIVIMPYNNEEVIIDGTTASVTMNQELLKIYIDYCIVDNITVRNSSGRGIGYHEVSNITIKNCTIHDVQYRAIGGYAHYVTIEGNEIYNAMMANENGSICNNGDCNGGGWSPAINARSNYLTNIPSTNIVIRNNNIYDCWGEGMNIVNTIGVLVEGNTISNTFSVGIYVDKAKDVVVKDNFVFMNDDLYNRPDRSYPANGISLSNEAVFHEFSPQVSNVLIYNNILAGCGRGITYFQDSQNTEPENTYTNIGIYYNVIYAPVDRAFRIAEVGPEFPAPSFAYLKNNIIFSVEDQPSFFPQASLWDISHNNWIDSIPEFAMDVNSFTGTPYSVAPDLSIEDQSQYYLQAGSNCIGAGTPIVGVTTDILGAFRDSLTPSVGIHEYALEGSPIANFYAGSTNSQINEVINFTDSSIGGPSSWLWNFGDGNTSTMQNPSYSYTDIGSYTISLTVNNETGTDIETKTAYILVTDNTSGSVSVSVIDGDDDAEEDRTDGSMSRNSSDLEIGNDGGDHQYVGIRFQNVEVPKGANISNAYLKFKAKATDSGAMTIFIDQEDAGNTLTFTSAQNDISNRQLTEEPVSYVPENWSANQTYYSADISSLIERIIREDGDWGNGNAMTFVLWSELDHTIERSSYSFNGGYSVILEFDYSLSTTVIAEFQADKTIALNNEAIQFSDISTGDPESWLWDFGDGSTSTLQNPTHTYTTVGIYSVSLTATNANGSDTETKENYIMVSDPPAPIAEFGSSNTTISIGGNIDFTDLSTNNPLSWLWDFGDGNTSILQNPSHTYSTLGNYTVALTASNPFGSNTETKFDYVNVNSGSGSVSVSVIDGDDDAEEDRTGNSIGDMSRNSGGLDIGNQGGVKQYVGIRFQNIIVPQGAVISNAKLIFTARANDDEIMSISIDQENSGNTLTFSNDYDDISDRILTGNPIVYAPEAWVKNQTYASTDISQLIQEIVDVGGNWESGNAMTFVLWSDLSHNDERVAYSYNGGTPVKLEFDYSLPPSAQILASEDSRIKENMQVKVYPNPSKGIINVDISLLKNLAVDISIYDVHGRLLHRKKLNKDHLDNIELESNRLVNGVYLLQLKIPGRNMVLTEQIIISK